MITTTQNEMASRPIHDGMTVDASEVQNLKCPGCGEPLGLDVNKPQEGVDHADCGIRVGLSAPAPQTRYTITLNRLEIPIRTFKEDKAVKKEEAQKEAKQAAEKDEAANKAGARRK